MHFSWFSAKFRTHPAEASLLAYRDAELPTREHATVENHLKRCASCQDALASLEMDIRTFEEVAGALEVAGSRVEIGTFPLQDAMAGQMAARSGFQRREYWFELPEDILATVCAELEIYLGRKAAQGFLNRAKTRSHTAQELVDAVEPLMGGLLGTEGGEAVAKSVALLCGASPPHFPLLQNASSPS